MLRLTTQWASSIQREGQIAAILVRRIGKRYELIAGERRVRAIRDHTDIKTIQARIVVADDVEARRLSAAENALREDLTVFEAIEAIQKTEKAMDEITAVDRLLALISIPVPSFVSKGDRTYQNAMLTLWARYRIGLPAILSSIALDQFRPVFHDLWSARDAHPTVKPSMKSSFLDWLSETTGLTHSKITQELGGVLDRLFEEIQSECGGIADKHLDPRYIQLFLVKA